MDKNRVAFQFDFDGACIPPAYGNSVFRTFSVGIFQWVPKSSGKGLKRGKAIKRIRGSTANSREVLDRAEKMCSDLQREFGYSLWSAR